MNLNWVGAARVERALVIAFEESLARYPNGRVLVSLPPTHPRFRLTTNPASVESSSSSPPIQLGSIVCTSSAFTTTTIRAYSDQVSRISCKRSHSFCCRRASVAARIPRNLGIELCSICQQFTPRFAYYCAIKTAAASLLSSDVILTVQLRH